MLFWREKIKTREKILMICFIFYLNCLNDKEKWLILSIYKKYYFLYAWESRYPSVLKVIHILTERVLKGNLNSPSIWFPGVICNQTWESLNIPGNSKTLPCTKRQINVSNHHESLKQKPVSRTIFTFQFGDCAARTKAKQKPASGTVVCSGSP